MLGSQTMIAYVGRILIIAGMLAFLLNYSLENLYGINGYLVGAFLTSAGVLLSRKREFYSRQFTLYLALMIATCLFHFLSGGLSKGFFEAFLCYVVFPSMAYLVSFEETEQDFIIKFVALTGLISFAGSLLFYVNIFFGLGQLGVIFDLEFTQTMGALQVKNTSIYGSSLVSGVVALVQASCCALLIKKGYSNLWWLVFFLCVATLFASLSRRAMIPFALVLFFLMQDLRVTQKRNVALFAILGFGTIAYLVPGVGSAILNRFVSVFDLGSTFEGGNASRLQAIWFGITQVAANPLGTGFGSLSSIGKERDALLSGEEIEGFLGVTESFYVTVVGEVGLLQCFFIALIFVGKYREIFKDLRWRFVFLPLLVESIMGLGFLNPIISLFSLMCVMPEIRKNRARENLKDGLNAEANKQPTTAN